MADQKPAPSKDDSGPANWNLPTGGGKQFWSDELLFRDWRIQRHAYTGHYRLLDGKNVRHAWGDFDHCRQVLDEIKQKRQLPPMGGQVVVVLHGLGRTRQSMADLCRYLREKGQLQVLNVSYASTRRTVAEHARSLARVLENLHGIQQIDFVAHSLGNLVIRRYLADHADPRIRRFVMLAPPNNGAQLARRFRHNPLFSLVWGKSGNELARQWDQLEKHLAVPACQFGIIAGGKGKPKGGNPLLEGDDDLVVTVEETRLPGARDFVVVPAAHTFIMNDPTVQQYTLRFLQHGYFIADNQRQPIPRAAADQPPAK